MINYSVDFTKENTLRNILGFDSKVIYSGYNYSSRKVNIIDVDSIHLCCDSIIGVFETDIHQIFYLQ